MCTQLWRNICWQTLSAHFLKIPRVSFADTEDKLEKNVSA